MFFRNGERPHKKGRGIIYLYIYFYIWAFPYFIPKTKSFLISTFSEKGDQRMSGSRFLYVTIRGLLRLIIALHLCMMFFTFFCLFCLFNYDQKSHVHWWLLHYLAPIYSCV